MNVKSKIQGAKNRENGALFETMIDAACNAYYDMGEALIEKTPEPMRVLKPLGNGQYVAVFTKAAQPDYKGILSNGTMVVFDAKYTESDRIAQSRVTQDQWESLDGYQRMGAHAFVVCGFSSGKAYRIPWGVWQGMKELFGHKYVTEEDIAGFRVRADTKIWFLNSVKKTKEGNA